MTYTADVCAFCVLITAVVTGCAVSSAIENADAGKSEFDGALYGEKTSQINTPIPGVDKHRIFHQGSSGFTSVETIRNSALKRVDDFCGRTDKRAYLIQETSSTPPHVLGNWPRIEIIFSCVKSSTQSAPAQQDKYDRLSKLKALLDSGAITQQEYETEKKRVLLE